MKKIIILSLLCILLTGRLLAQGNRFILVLTSELTTYSKKMYERITIYDKNNSFIMKTIKKDSLNFCYTQYVDTLKEEEMERVESIINSIRNGDVAFCEKIHIAGTYSKYKLQIFENTMNSREYSVEDYSSCTYFKYILD